MDVSNRIELSLQLGKLRCQAEDVATAIDHERKQLLKAYCIPGTQQDAERFLNEFQCFQAERYEVHSDIDYPNINFFPFRACDSDMNNSLHPEMSSFRYPY
jgi:hypothetical protein